MSVPQTPEIIRINQALRGYQFEEAEAAEIRRFTYITPVVDITPSVAEAYTLFEQETVDIIGAQVLFVELPRDKTIILQGWIFSAVGILPAAITTATLAVGRRTSNGGFVGANLFSTTQNTFGAQGLQSLTLVPPDVVRVTVFLDQDGQAQYTVGLWGLAQDRVVLPDQPTIVPVSGELISAQVPSAADNPPMTPAESHEVNTTPSTPPGRRRRR